MACCMRDFEVQFLYGAQKKDKKSSGVMHANLPVDFIGQFGTSLLLVILAGTCGDGA